MSRLSIFNFIMFQAGWFACVLSAANHMPWIGAVISLAILALHIFIANDHVKEILFILSAMAIGLVWESLLVQSSWIGFTSGYFLADLAPYWIVLMWGLFASTINVSLSWLKTKLMLASVLGAVGGPMAYYGGQKLGAVQLLSMTHILVALAIGWGLLTPVLLLLSNKFNGFEHKQKQLA